MTAMKERLDRLELADSCHRLRLWQWADTRQKGSPVASGAEKRINT